MTSFELCCSDIQSVIFAQRYKVEGIELCTNLKEGGVTPSIGFVRAACEIFKGSIAVLIRARPGSFYYSDVEKKIMLDEIPYLIESGVDTIVFGALNTDNTIDEEFLQEICTNSRSAKLCFHKAVDITQDLFSSLETLKKFRIHRVLTSGGKLTAIEGVENLKKLVQVSENTIEIMLGGSIKPEHIHQLIQETGVTRIHAALRNSRIVDQEIVDEELLKKAMNKIRILNSQKKD
ncbi:MAG: copper homeostasis protein CutC [Saprospiraceae bacterium]|nr:copper homeostasis protein CutC [Saprospiraceae bacterium]